MADKTARIHGVDPSRKDQPNRWFGADTCQCLCGCGFIALGDFFDKPLCRDCYRRHLREGEAAGGEGETT